METSLLIFLPRLLDYIRLASEMCLKDLWKKFNGDYLPMASLRVPAAKLLVIDHPIAVNSRYWFNFGCIFQNNC